MNLIGSPEKDFQHYLNEELKKSANKTLDFTQTAEINQEIDYNLSSSDEDDLDDLDDLDRDD